MVKNCDIKRIKATRLCSGDLRHLVDIQSRELVESGFDSSQPVETFTTTRQQWCAIETISPGVARFAKINIQEGATHIFWCFWDAGLDEIENRNTYISYDSKRFKALCVDNVNERNTVLAIQTTERGEDSEEASQA